MLPYLETPKTLTEINLGLRCPSYTTATESYDWGLQWQKEHWKYVKRKKSEDREDEVIEKLTSAALQPGDGIDSIC